MGIGKFHIVWWGWRSWDFGFIRTPGMIAGFRYFRWIFDFGPLEIRRLA